MEQKHIIIALVVIAAMVIAFLLYVSWSAYWEASGGKEGSGFMSSECVPKIKCDSCKADSNCAGFDAAGKMVFDGANGAVCSAQEKTAFAYCKDK